VDFSKATPVVEFNLGGQAYFGADAITESGDTVVKQFAVSVTTASVPTTATTVDLAIDPSIIATYNAANTAVTYQAFPATAYSFTATKVTIPAGQRVAIVSVTFYKSQFDPSQSYMLPIKIVSTTGGYTISGNMAIHYYHYIGNDFAGGYEHFYDRWSSPPDSLSGVHDNNHVDIGPEIFAPITPNEFTVPTAYYTGPRYDVTFDKTGTGAAATYSNFQIKFFPADVADGTGWATNITLVVAPKLTVTGYDPNHQYTKAEAIKLFRFCFQTATRFVVDTYVPN